MAGVSTGVYSNGYIAFSAQKRRQIPWVNFIWNNSPSQPKEINNNNLTIKEIDNPMDSQTITAPYKRISPGYMLLMLISTFAISIIYYRMALLFSNNPMPMFDYVVFTSVVAITIVGAYQIFFWVQNNNYFFKTHCLAIGIDKYIPFWPILIFY